MTSEIHTFLLTWLLIQKVTGLTEFSNLDMAPDAFDDQYEGCVEEMENKARQLLKEDFNMNKKLKYAWKDAENQWNEIKTRMNHPKGFRDVHGTALVAYSGQHIYKDFNEAVRKFKKNPRNFHYKAFHYYLTRALQLLHNNNCYSVYRGTQNKFNYSKSGSVRFGQFTSSSLKQSVALHFINSTHGTLYTIKTCLGVYIKAFSKYRGEEEVLIPGYEVFHKVDVERSTKGYDKIILDSPERKKSNFNCFYSYVNSSGARASLEFLLLVVLLPALLVQLLPLAELQPLLPAVCGAE